MTNYKSDKSCDTVTLRYHNWFLANATKQSQNILYTACLIFAYLKESTQHNVQLNICMQGTSTGSSLTCGPCPATPRVSRRASPASPPTLMQCSCGAGMGRSTSSRGRSSGSLTPRADPSLGKIHI